MKGISTWFIKTYSRQRWYPVTLILPNYNFTLQNKLIFIKIRDKTDGIFFYNLKLITISLKFTTLYQKKLKHIPIYCV